MAYKDLTFLLNAKDMSASRGFEKVALSADGMSKGVAGSLGMAGVAVAGLAISIGAKTVEMAGNFQAATTRLVTDAGESSRTIGKLSDGLLNISAETGTSADEIAKGMYKVSSAGYTMAHGGLTVMRAAAEGAKIGGADLTTVADALTTVLKDYGLKGKDATRTTSELIETVSLGKTSMEDLAGSLHNVLPNAQALGIHLNDVLAALATMTQEGISADQATQNLNHTIVSMANPTNVQTQAMAAMGLNSTKVAAQLGRRGITGTLNDLVGAITSHIKGGLVLQKSFTNSELAAQSANAMFKSLPSSVRATASSFEKGTISQKTWTTAVKAMTPAHANLAKQWAATENKAKGFSDSLKSGSGPARTFTSQLAKMTGGQVGLQTALHLTGIHGHDAADAVKKIGDASKGTQKHVSDWSLTQSTHNQKMAEFGSWAQKAAIKIGSVLLPAVDNFTTNLMYGAKQWGDIFKAIGKWWGDTVASFARGAKQLNDFFNGVVHNFDDGRKQIVGGFTNAGHWLLGAGKSIIEGLVKGIRGGEKLITGAVSWLSGLIPSGVKKFLHINSPSKVMIPIGASVGEGLQVGILGSAKQVAAATKSLTTMVIGMFDSGTIGSATKNSALHTISGGTATLIAEANKRAAIAKQIVAAQKTLTKDLKAQKKASDASLKDSIMSDGNITSFAAPGDAIQGLQALIGNTRRFKTDLQSLVKKGIDGNTLKELIGAGVSGGGLTMADQLLANPTDFKEIVAMQNQLAGAAGSLASFAGRAEYGSTIKSDRSKLARLKGAERVETWKMQKTAAGMISAIGRETHVHIHLTGHYAGTKDDLAKSVTTAIRDAVRRGQLPKNVLTAL